MYESKVSEELANLGIGLRDSCGEMKTATDVLQEIAKVYEVISDEQREILVSTLFEK